MQRQLSAADEEQGSGGAAGGRSMLGIAFMATRDAGLEAEADSYLVIRPGPQPLKLVKI